MSHLKRVMIVLALDHSDQLPLIADACSGSMADYCARRVVVARNDNQGGAGFGFGGTLGAVSGCGRFTAQNQ
jgi:hypothetical protein